MYCSLLRRDHKNLSAKSHLQKTNLFRTVKEDLKDLLSGKGNTLSNMKLLANVSSYQEREEETAIAKTHKSLGPVL